uniref:Peptidase C19 ubiquitin carboxyl-terminal hydrolase domain-containing protein n=1 Tax=Salix viminalis TaxID=40686 RepID=A0A6N2MIW7_SALVM
MNLELDNAVQQDGHEFLTLLLSLLERCLNHSKISKVKKAVQDLFRGSVSQVLKVWKRFRSIFQNRRLLRAGVECQRLEKLR